MKKKYLQFLFFILFLNSLISIAQKDPGKINLIHQWTFDNGTANDVININSVNGVLQGGATIKDRALIFSSQGQFLSFSGSALALNTYSVISQEIWYCSVAGANTGYTMLSYFGNISGGLGYNYIYTSTARKDNVSRTAISNGTYNSEIYANGPEYDDGIVHHMISVIDADSIFLYIDGELTSKVINTISLSTIGTSLAYLGKSGYTDDPTWIGTIYKFSIYNKKLTPDEVKYLYNKGPEESKMFAASVNSVAFDEFYTSQKITVSMLNISDTVKITMPDGITVTPSIIPAKTNNLLLTLNYDTSFIVDGNINFLGKDTLYLTIPVKSLKNNCYSKLYPDAENLIFDPFISDLDFFSGWGNRSINNDIKYVYCGATSGKVSGINGGSLDVNLTGKLLPNTKYRIKAKVYLTGGSFQIGIFGWSDNQPDYNKIISITDSWQDVDFTFTTGSPLGLKQGVFFNNYGLTGITGYIDNWEMYAVPEIYLSLSNIEFLTQGSKKVTIRKVNINKNIFVSATDGFTVSKNELSNNKYEDTLTISFTGKENRQGYVYFVSGDIKDSIFVKGNAEPVLISSVSVIALDEINRSAKFLLTGYNLNTNITFTVPEGISLSSITLPVTTINDTVTVYYDGISNSSGTITLYSGSAIAEIKVIAKRNDECFIPLYKELTNLIIDPTCNYYIKDGWGNRSINSEPEFVYCGARSAKIQNGSIERILTGVMKSNTTYRVKAKVYKESPVKGDNMGNVSFTLYLDSASYPEQYRLIYEAMDSACGYFSKYTSFIENIPVYYNTSVPTAQAGYRSKIEFGSNTRYMWVGTAIHEMAHYFGSGTTNIWQSLMLNGVWTGKSGTALMNSINGGVINGDSQHYWPYGINYKEEITNLGSVEAQKQALISAVKIIKAMLIDDCNLPTNNTPVGIGIYGWDINSKDIYHEVLISNSWQDIDFSFKTGEVLKESQKIYFNYGTGYIDNWEMYDMDAVNIVHQSFDLYHNVYIRYGKPVIEIELEKESLVNVSVYDIHGKLIYIEDFKFGVGINKKVIDKLLPEGIYIIKILSNEFIISKKVVSL
jgi:hypothetical protein